MGEHVIGFMSDVPEPKTRREARRWIRLFWSRWLYGQDAPDGQLPHLVSSEWDAETRAISERIKR